MNGNDRAAVLQERGVDVDELPREAYGAEEEDLE